MSQIIAITVPEVGIGDLPVTDIHVCPGDFVHANDAVLTLQTAAGAVQVPSGIMGTIREVLVRVGDMVREEQLIGRVEMGARPRQPVPARIMPQATVPAAMPEPPVAESPPSEFDSLLPLLPEGLLGSEAVRAAAAMLAEFEAMIPDQSASPDGNFGSLDNPPDAATPATVAEAAVLVENILPEGLLDVAAATAMLEALPVLDAFPAASPVETPAAAMPPPSVSSQIAPPQAAVVLPFPAPATAAAEMSAVPPVPASTQPPIPIPTFSVPAMSDNTSVITPPPAPRSPVQLDCDLLVLGAGPGGYSAAFRSADLGLKTVLVERYATLGGVCLNVGCIPSKALLHIAAVLEEARQLAEHGVTFGTPQIDIDKLRGWKNKVVGKLTGGLGGMAKGRKVTQVQGIGQFTGPNTLQAVGADGTITEISFRKAIIAAGSQAVKLPFMPDDPRIIDSTGALELPGIPQKMLVIGGGIIGLEMATVYAALGARITVVELGKQLMPGADADLVKVWSKYNASRFARILLETGVTAATASPAGITVTYSTGEQETFDLVLVAVGRTPNGKKIAADRAGVTVTDRGFIPVDARMRTNVPHIFAIGDIVGQPMLAHKAVHEAHVAAEVAAGELQGNAELARAAFEPLLIPSVAYTNPEVAWAGKTEEQCAAAGIAVEKAVFPWAASGRAIANGRDEGFTKLLFDATTHRVIGGAIVGTGAGDLIGEVCLAIEMGCDAVDIGKTIHPHPTLCESVGMAAEVAHGTCTDLPPARKKK